MQHKLAAILFYDVVGYSRAMGLNESATHKTLKGNHSTIIQPLAQLHGGRIIKEMGDGGFIEFPSSMGAVRFAIGMQIAVADGNADKPEHQKFYYRIGINIGDVLTDGTDVFGYGVNVASRLEGTAEAGGICVHQTVRNQVRGKLDIDFQDLGEVKLKNIEFAVPAHNILMNEKAEIVAAMPVENTQAPVQKSRRRLVSAAVLFAFLTLGAALWWQVGSPPVAVASIERMSYPLPDKPSVAVLPFMNMSDDRSQEHFADGLTEDLITDLSHIAGLFIVARNSTFVYKNQSVNIAQVAEDLGVRYVLEGSVRRAGDQVRVNAQLIDATTGGHIWAERYDGPVADIFSVQDEFIRKIANALAVELTAGEAEEIAVGQTANLNAREAFQKGWESYLSYNAKDNALAADLFKSAIEIDPEYGRAYAALGLVYLRGCRQRWNRPLGVSVDEATATAVEYIDKAESYPSSLANVASSRSSLYFGKFDVAQSEATRAVAKDPNDPEAYVALAWAMIANGQPETALELMDRATRLNPIHPSYYLLVIGTAHFIMDNFETAATVFADQLERDPSAIELAAVLASTYAHLGRLEEANEAMRIWKPEASQRELQAAPYLYHFALRWAHGSEIESKIKIGLHAAALPLDDPLSGLVATLQLASLADRVRAAKVLGLLGYRAEEAVPALIGELDHDAATLRSEAAIALGKIGAVAKEAVPALQAVSGDPTVGQHAQVAIKKIVGK